MTKENLKNLLMSVKDGTCSVEDALNHIQTKSFLDLDYAKIDTNRELRQGIAEVIYGESKSIEQIQGIVEHMVNAGQKTILITRLSKEKAYNLSQIKNFTYYEKAKIGIVGEIMEPKGCGKVLIVTGGTSDQDIAEEAAVTATALGNQVVRLYDVGVSGIHRLLENVEILMNANVVIAVAGMEGALASVVGGLVDCPVIAVPTSVGYGSAFEGLAALLSMLNSCASGVSVVNIDNGFGAGYLASMINHRTQKGEP